MVAGCILRPHEAVDTGGTQPSRAQQKMVQPHPGTTREMVAEIIPDDEHRRVRMQSAQCVGPALVDRATIGSPRRVGTEAAPRARIATPFQLLWPSQTVSWPACRRASAANAASSAFSPFCKALVDEFDLEDGDPRGGRAKSGTGGRVFAAVLQIGTLVCRDQLDHAVP